MRVELHFFTTSEIGKERPPSNLPNGVPGLKYWKRAAAGAPLSPLREILGDDRFSQSVRAFCQARNDAVLRRDLIARIRWDCGKPDFADLRKQLEDRIVVVGRDRFELPAQDAVGLADHLVYCVMEKSIANDIQNRVLGRADLYKLIDQASRVSLPRTTIEHLTGNLSTLARTLTGAGATDSSLSVADTDWLIDSRTLPHPQGMIPRTHIAALVTDALDRCGIAVLVGASGLGKTIISRAVIGARVDNFTIVDFRYAEADEARHILDLLFGRIGGLSSSALILEDLNCLADQRVALSLGRVVDAARRQYLNVVVTCYQRPSLKTANAVDAKPFCLVNCPYLSEKETRSLVRKNGGNPSIWGRLAYAAGAGGHPQLTHAFVVGIATRGWRVGDLDEVIRRGLSSGDIESARDEARRSLISALSDDSRNLLYRLSLTNKKFNRSLGLAIAEIRPSVSHAGECLDQLVGPWIETVGAGLFRVSPLASSFGRDMLSSDEQQRIHETFAVQIIKDQLDKSNAIDASDVDTIMMHAILGRSPHCLVIIARNVLSADHRTLETLAEQLLMFRFFKTDVPIYPELPFVAVMLRVAQFKLAAASRDTDTASEVSAALFNEIDAIRDHDARRGPETIAIVAVLNTIGVADYLRNWLSLILRFKAMVADDGMLQGVSNQVESATSVPGTSPLSILFSVGIAGLSSVERLEQVIDDLDNLQEADRQLLLTPIDMEFSNHYHIISGPWAIQQRNNSLDATDAAVRYERMAKKTRKWRVRTVSLQCSVAQAVILDEYQDNKEGALAALDDAVSRLGPHPILSRSKAKVLWRHSDYANALELLRTVVDPRSEEDPIERTFTLRMAAISAAKCGDWSLAEEWFLGAQRAAKTARRKNMDVMAIGLGADSAVAALELNDIGRALTCLAETLEELAQIDPNAHSRAADCHRLVGYTVLWLRLRVEGSDVNVSGVPIRIEPGTCSDPEPPAAIRDWPMRHIDVSWYMLATTEAIVGVDVGIGATLDNRLGLDPIPILEANLHRELIQTEIARIDPGGFAKHFRKYVEFTTYCLKHTGGTVGASDALHPERGKVPSLDQITPLDPTVMQVANDAIIAFLICSGIERRYDAVSELESNLVGEFGTSHPGKSVFDYWNGESTSISELEKTVISVSRNISQTDYVEPRDFWLAGLRLFEWINKYTLFLDLLTGFLSRWMRSGWTRISTKEKFRLTTPLRTVPGIDQVLQIPTDDRSFVARLILATSEAVGSPLGTDYKKLLAAMAHGPKPSNNP